MQKIYLDLAINGTERSLSGKCSEAERTVYAKQGDVGRKFVAVITDNGEPYFLQDGLQFSVWYSGTGGQGNYSSIGESSAFIVDGNTVTVELITQMLTNAGGGLMCLVIHDAQGGQIGLWNIRYVAEAVPGMGSQAAEQYYTAFSEAVKNLPYPDTSLTAPGKAADAAAVGAALTQRLTAIEDANHPGCYYRTVDGVAEWINPPMTVGVEYRTMERWNGKTVYMKAYSVGNLPNTSYVDISYNIENLDRVISCVGSTNSNMVLPNISTSAPSTVNLISGGDYFRITTATDRSGLTAVVVLKYTKTTD